MNEGYPHAQPFQEFPFVNKIHEILDKHATFVRQDLTRISFNAFCGSKSHWAFYFIQPISPEYNALGYLQIYPGKKKGGLIYRYRFLTRQEIF